MSEEKESKLMLPAFDNSQYMVQSTVWNELTTETTRLNQLIDSGYALTPEDVKDVRALAKTVKDYGVLYRRAITKRATEYKNLLNTKLTEIGYDKIEQYVDIQKRKAAKERNDRLTDKLNTFSKLVDTCLAKTKAVRNSRFTSLVASNLAHRYPAINSGAKAKEIKDWSIIKLTIQNSLNAVDVVLLEYPILLDLPASSSSINTILSYLSTGNDDFLSDNVMHDAMIQDEELIRNIAVKKQITNDHDALDQISKILKNDMTESNKIKSIYRLLTLYLN